MSTAAASTKLDERYGRTPDRRRWDRRGVWVAAGAFVVVFTAWVVWGGIDGTTTTVNTQDTAHSVVDEHGVNVTWQVTMEPGSTATCAVQAQNQAHGIVGWKIVDVAASAARTQAVTELVKTTELSVTGLIYRCWPT